MSPHEPPWNEALQFPALDFVERRWLCCFPERIQPVGAGVCRVPTSLKPIFGDAWTKEQLFSQAEVANHLQDYIQEQGLAEGSEVKLDELFVGNLYNKKEPQQAGNLDDFDEVLRRLLGKLQQFHRVLRQSPQVRCSCSQSGLGAIRRADLRSLCMLFIRFRGLGGFAPEKKMC